MNKLVLVGNGFDLAHGMKTSYNDFILYYLKKCFRNFNSSMWYDDSLLNITSKICSNPSFRNTDEFIDHCYEHNLIPSIFADAEPTGNIHYLQLQFEINIKSALLKKILLKCSANSWVAIENTFYECLKLSLKSPTKMNLGDLNRSMEVLTKELEEYLLKQPTDAEIPGIVEFISPTLACEINHPTLGKHVLGSNYESMVLNFNYTNTIEKYLEKLELSSRLRTSVNYIHGQLSEIENPIIFGFGDEVDVIYKEIENSQNNLFFKYIKSFGYFKTPNYRKLIDYIDSGDFEVVIMGLSCGVSDRTMLKMIFEHENCKSVEICYYKNIDGYLNTTYEISRHFTDKDKMRRRIKQFGDCKRMPQLEEKPANEIVG